jgi:hypothetical protein
LHATHRIADDARGTLQRLGNRAAGRLQERLALVDRCQLAQGAGFRTAAVMPQITLPWPEAALMGFDTVLAAADLGYRGLPFNWVTMPDQFTLAAFERMELGDGPRQRRQGSARCQA